MKEQAIQKINTIGKIGAIISKIISVLMIIGIIGTLIGTIACYALPKDLVTVKLNGSAIVTSDVSKIKTLSENQQKDLSESFQEAQEGNGSFDVNGSDYYIGDYSVNKNGFTLDCHANLTSFNMRNIANVCLIGFISCIFAYINVLAIHKLCKELRDCHSPFEDGIIKKLQFVGYSFIPWVFISGITSAVVQNLLGGSFAFSFNGSVVILVLVILGLSYIFKYGSLLQAESDETL